MKKLITLSLVCCLVLAMGAPVSADFLWERCNAHDFTNALLNYCTHNDVTEMYGKACTPLELDGYDIMFHNIERTDDSLNFTFDVEGLVIVIPTILAPYKFSGKMHVDTTQDGIKVGWHEAGDEVGLKSSYTIKLPPGINAGYSARGPNWILEVKGEGASFC